MTASTPILALATYPLLFSLPLNPIRFLWGFRQGLAPMPPEVQEKADAADRAVLFGIHLTILTIVSLLMNGSSLSAHAVGLTTDNWKSAIYLGAFVSLIPQGISAISTRIISPRELREAPLSHGPFATWCGLIALGSVSTEFWRVFCIAALIRFDIPAWIAVLVVALVSGASELSTSTARAAGSAFYGILPGLLFINTGSLLAPLTMGLIAGGSHLYRYRHVPPRMLEGSAASSRYSKVCPACGTVIRASEIPRGRGDCFPCPACNELLMYDHFILHVITAVSFLLAVFAAWTLGYRDTTFVLIVFPATLLLWFFGIIVAGILFPSPLKRFKRAVWFPYDNRYSPAIWACSFVIGIVITFSLGYIGDSLHHYAMFIVVGDCITLLLGFMGNFLVGMLIPLPPNQSKGDPFNSAGSLNLTNKRDGDNQTNSKPGPEDSQIPLDKRSSSR